MKRLAVLLALSLLTSARKKNFCEWDDKDRVNCTFSCYGEKIQEDLEIVPNRMKEEADSCESLTFNLMDAVLKYLPSELFLELKTMEQFNFVAKNSTIFLLGPHVDEYNPFKKLKFKSGVFQVWGARSLNGWGWEKFQGLDPQDGGTFRLLVVDSVLTYLPAKFSLITQHLSSVHLCGCQLSWLAESVFAPFTKLKILELRNNNLKVIKRSHLPEGKDNELMTLDLGQNRLTSLEPNFFNDLKKLQYVMLDNNPGLKVLDHGLSNQMPKGLKEFYLNCESICDNWSEVNEKIRSLVGTYYSCIIGKDIKTLEEVINDCS